MDSIPKILIKIVKYRKTFNIILKPFQIFKTRNFNRINKLSEIAWKFLEIVALMFQKWGANNSSKK